ncbi:ABC-2 type transport system permease protein [Thermocatellispora tengchongensis]|uniref:ABC-2 type transport system permease protein n=1 Tax=Thermocatellispora tengchongensis TaxID=1073253 RepID=A0A840PK41_9ACTN|nr:ABC transporter permease [Thermocatellispora tengchongensis]MBB5139286.1 ABC-2 type transport system permease protein [Thermocatellispora tengchongensis]
MTRVLGPTARRDLGEWRLIGIVARHELRNQWRKNAFWTSGFLTVLLICLALGTVAYLGGNRDAAPAVGVVGDRPHLVTALEREVKVERFASVRDARSAVREGRVDAAVAAGGEILVSWTLDPGLGRLLRQAYVTAGYAERLTRLGTPPDAVANASPPLRVVPLTADVALLQERTLAAVAGVSMLLIMMMFFGNSIMRVVVEEKTSRLAEMLLLKIDAWQLLTGKIIGVGAAALGQILAAFAAAAALALGAGVFDRPGDVLAVAANLVLWFVPAFILFTGLYAIAGSLVSVPDDVHHTGTPVSLVQLLGVFGPAMVVLGANETVTAVVSVIPGFSWTTMPVRMAHTDVPWWQVGVAYALMLLTVRGLIRTSSTTYTTVFLHAGRRITVQDCLRGQRS